MKYRKIRVIIGRKAIINTSISSRGSNLIGHQMRQSSNPSRRTSSIYLGPPMMVLQKRQGNLWKYGDIAECFFNKKFIYLFICIFSKHYFCNI